MQPKREEAIDIPEDDEEIWTESELQATAHKSMSPITDSTYIGNESVDGNAGLKSQSQDKDSNSNAASQDNAKKVSVEDSDSEDEDLTEEQLEAGNFNIGALLAKRLQSQAARSEMRKIQIISKTIAVEEKEGKHRALTTQEAESKVSH